MIIKSKTTVKMSRSQTTRTISTDFFNSIIPWMHSLEDSSRTQDRTPAVCSNDSKVATPQTQNLCSRKTNQDERRHRAPVLLCDVFSNDKEGELKHGWIPGWEDSVAAVKGTFCDWKLNPTSRCCPLCFPHWLAQCGIVNIKHAWYLGFVIGQALTRLGAVK